MVRVFARPGRASSSWVGIAPGLHPYGRGTSRRGSCRFGRWPVDSGPPRVPEAVTALQGMLALNQAGHLQAVELLFQADDTPLPHRLAYQRAQEWLRTSPTVAYMQARMGWTDAFVDQLFRDAEKII